MNVEIEFENYNIKSPKMPDPFNVNLINAVGSGGGGGGNEVELTWAEYEALSEAEKMNGTNYFITDINTTKSLTSKVLLAPSTISANTDYALTDSYKNYDYVVIEVVNSEFRYVRATKMLNVQNGEGGGIIDFYQSSSWYGAAEVNFTSNTVMRIGDISQSNNAYTDPGSSKIRVTGYIYQRVVVPNQMINYSTIETKIGTWIDGKPLYQRTIAINNTAVGYTSSIHTEVPHNITDLKECHSLDICCPFLNVWGKSVVFNASNGSVIAAFAVDSTKIYATGGGNHYGAAENRWWYFTLKYTKTTD